MRRALATVLVVVLVVLAGCGGNGGGGGEPDNDVILQNANDLRNSVEPDQPATVEAEVQGDSVDDVQLEFRVLDRSGARVDSDEVNMSDPDGDDVYEATIPGQDPGFRVKYKVVASYTDTSTDQTASDSYNVSNVESVSGPTGRTTNEASEITVRLYEHAGVESVTVYYQRTSNVDGSEQNGSETAYSVDSNEVTITIPNEAEVGSDDNKTVEYTAQVTHTENQSFSASTRSYTYVDTEPADTLYLPIKFEASQSALPISKLGERGTKVDRYFYEQSGGDAELTHDVYRGGSADDDYVVLPNQTSYYINDSGDNPSYRSWKIINDAQEQVEDDVNFSDYDQVVYTVEETQGIVVRSFKWGSDGRGVYTSTNSEKNPYGDWAHELGHAHFSWPDYYYFSEVSNSNGRLYMWGIMGGGGESSALDRRPPQVSAFFRIQEGWATERTVSHSELPTAPDAREVTLTDLHEQGGGLNYSLPASASNSLFDNYLFAARDQRDVDNVPYTMSDSVGGLEYPEQGDGEGIVVYGVAPQSNDPTSLHYVLNPATENRDGDGDYEVRAVTLREGTDDVLRDPDAGIRVEAGESADGSSTVHVAKEDYENVEGVNVYLLLEDCQDVENVTDQGDCDALTEPDGTETQVYGALRAETDRGAVGYTENGTFVDEVNGSHYVSAGRVQKVYVPSNRSSRFVVDPPNVSTSNVTVVTQTVSRDGDGTRTASELESRTMDANETLEPELARLNVSTNSMNAGELRTLESETLELGVSNDGIRNLTNVTVSTNASWVSVDRNDVGTLADSSETGVEVTVDVPAGQPVGNYTFDVTVTGDGTESTQRETVTVNVTVLPTVHWHATTDDQTLTLANADTAESTTTVVNSPASNVPLRDVETTVSGNVTRFDVTAPAFVETLEPGERTTLTTTVAVPEGGIEEGEYEGTITVDVLDEYGRYFEYPVPVEDEYVVPNETEYETSVEVAAHGPSVNSTATFHPEEQVAMRKGSATERVTVEPVSESQDVPLDRLSVRATVPEGWSFQSSKGREVRDRDVKVWIVEDAKSETKAGHGGKRHKLSPDAYDLRVEDGAVYVTVPNVTETSFGRHMTTDDALEFEFKLNKRPKADSYGYDSTVDVQSTSPQAIYRTERPVASVDVFRPPTGTERGTVGDHPGRVPDHAVRAGKGIGGKSANVTDVDLESVDVNGAQTHWLRFTLDRDRGASQRYLWVRVGANGTLDATVSADGYVALEGVVTPPLDVVFENDLRRGGDVTVQLPVENTTAGSVAFAASTADSELATAAVLTDRDGERVLQLTPTNATADDTLPIPVVVGDRVFDRPNEAANRTASA